MNVILTEICGKTGNPDRFARSGHFRGKGENMGYMSARDMVEHTDLETAIRWHLKYNCYPELPTELTTTCRLALTAFHAGQYEEKFELPDGLSWRDRRVMTAAEIVDACRLDAFVDVIGRGKRWTN